MVCMKKAKVDITTLRRICNWERWHAGAGTVGYKKENRKFKFKIGSGMLTFVGQIGKVEIIRKDRTLGWVIENTLTLST